MWWLFFCWWCGFFSVWFSIFVVVCLGVYFFVCVCVFFRKENMLRAFCKFTALSSHEGLIRGVKGCVQVPERNTLYVSVQCVITSFDLRLD